MKHLAVALLAFGVSGTAFAQASWDEVEIKAEPVGGAVHVIYGAGGNIGVSAGADGVFLVDDQYAPLTERILKTVRTISDGPVRYVINTHFHDDHTSGNENVGKAGSVIVAHDNVRQRVTEGSFIEVFNMRTPPREGKALPVITFSDQMSLHLNGEDTRIIHVENAHTDGDSIVYFQGSNVVHMGDTFFNDRLPFIDVPHGGNVDGVISAAEMVLSIADDKTRIIPGHGPVTDRQGLQKYHDMLVEARDKVAALKEKGLLLDAIVAQKPLKDLDPYWLEKGEDWTKLFIGFVYDSL